MIVDPQHRYSNESERVNQIIFVDFKLKNLLVYMVYTKIIESFKV